METLVEQEFDRLFVGEVNGLESCPDVKSQELATPASAPPPAWQHTALIYARTAFRMRWSIAAAAVLSTLATVLICSRLPPTYSATAVLAVDDVNQSADLMATHQRLLVSDAVLRPVAARYWLLARENQLVHWMLIPDTLHRQIAKQLAPITLHHLKITRVAGSSLLEVAYTDRDSQLAANVANDIARSYIHQLESLDRAKPTMVRLADPARPSSDPISFNTPLVVTIDFITYAVVCTLLFVRLGTREQVRNDPSAVARAAGVAVLSALPHVVQMDKMMRLRALDEYSSMGKTDYAFFDEAIEKTLVILRLSAGGDKALSLLVTSSAPHEGKSSAAVSLARANASHGRRTLLIDASMRKPAVRRLVFASIMDRGKPHFAEPGQWRDGLHSTFSSANLFVLDLSLCKIGSIASARGPLHRIVTEAAREFDMVIVDPPAVRDGLETLTLASAVASTLLIVHSTKTPASLVRDVVKSLRQANAPIAGVLLNHAPPASPMLYHMFKKYYSTQASNRDPELST